MTISKSMTALPSDVNRLLGWEQTHGRLADERAMRGARGALRTVQETSVEAHRDAANARLVGDLVNVGYAAKSFAGDLVAVVSSGDGAGAGKPLVELAPGKPEARLAELASEQRGREVTKVAPRAEEQLDLGEILRATGGVAEALGEKWAAQVIGSGHDDRVKTIDDAAKSIERAIAKAHELPKTRLV